MHSRTWSNPAIAAAVAIAAGVPAFAADGQSFGKVGVLIGSYGDVDDPSEVRELVVNTVSDPDVVPLPEFARVLIAQLGWQFSRQAILEEYAAIGNRTNFRATTEAQAEGVAALLRERDIDATSYVGLTQTFPYVREALQQAEADGIETLILFYQGAQYSRATSHLVFRDTAEYLAAHPEWRVKAIAVRSFSDDPRFRDLMAASIAAQLTESFPDSRAEDVCIFLPMHGNIMKWINEGDPYLDQILSLYADMQTRFSPSFVSIGFQNHDEIPFIAWTEPNTDEALEKVADHACSKVAINGRGSFTTDSLETLYDHAIAERQQLIDSARARGRDKDVVVAKMFNVEPGFVALLADLAAEALAGQGDIMTLGE